MTRRPGAVLLEVVVALAILGFVAATALQLALQAERGIAQARGRLDEVSRAGTFMEAVSLWPREDLDRHLGVRPEGPFLLAISRTGPSVYHVVIARAEPDGNVRTSILESDLYRVAAP